MSRILVIGGTGFIGRQLLPLLLAEGHELALLRRTEATTPMPGGLRAIVGNRQRLVESAKELREFRPDVVIDLILSSGAQARAMMNVFRGIASRVVVASSMDVYRACGILHRLEEGELEPLPLTEDSPLRSKLQTYPRAQIDFLKGVFGWLGAEYDKIPVEREVMNDPGLPGTVLRLPMIYGPGDPLHRWHPTLKRMDDARPFILLTASFAAWRSPRGFVNNVAHAIALAATNERATGRVYNVAEQESFSEAEWTRAIGDVVGWRGTVVTVPDDDAPDFLKVPARFEQHWVADSSRIRRELGYEEPIVRSNAIAVTVDWERANPPPNIDERRFNYVAEDNFIEHRPGSARES